VRGIPSAIQSWMLLARYSASSLQTQFARAGLLGSVDGLRKIMERRRGGDRLFGPDVGCPDHLAPPLGFLCDQLAEVGGRARERCAARIGEARARERPRHRSWIV